MARRQSKLELNLFPFLSVLCGLIAVLILQLFLNLQRGQAAVQDPWSGQGPAPKVTSGKSNSPGPREPIEQQREDRRKLLDEIKDRQAKLARLLEQKRQLEALRRLRDDPHLVDAITPSGQGEPIALNIPMEYRVADIGQGDIRKEPIQVEITAHRYLVHTADAPRDGYPTIQGETIDPGLRGFLEAVNRDQARKYLLLLVRPEGIPALQSIQKYCDKHFKTVASQEGEGLPDDQRFDYGIEPVPDHVELKVPGATRRTPVRTRAVKPLN